MPVPLFVCEPMMRLDWTLPETLATETAGVRFVGAFSGTISFVPERRAR